MNKPANLFLPIAGAIFGLPFLLIGLWGLRAGHEMDSWTWASGRVLVSEPVPGDLRAGRIDVAFPVGTKRYDCNVVERGWGTSRKDVREFPAGASAVVFYDPTQPARCALKPGVATGSRAFLIAGVALPILGALLARARPSRVKIEIVG